MYTDNTHTILTVSLEADCYGVHERERTAVVQLVPTTFLADDDQVIEDKEDSATLVLETRPRS